MASRSLLQGRVIEQLLDQVHVGQQHAAAAVALQAQRVQGVPAGERGRAVWSVRLCGPGRMGASGGCCGISPQLCSHLREGSVSPGSHLSHFPSQLASLISLGPSPVTLEASRKFSHCWPQRAEMATWERRGQAGSTPPGRGREGSCAGCQALSHCHSSSLPRVYREHWAHPRLLRSPHTPTELRALLMLASPDSGGSGVIRTTAVHTVA